MSRRVRLAAGMLALALTTSGCFGSFHLTRKVWTFNRDISDNKWVVEGAFLLMSWLPVYGIATLADAVIFNSVEFWTGENPIADMNTPGRSDMGTKRIVRGDSEALVSWQQGAQGPELVVEQFKDGQSLGTLRLVRQDGGMVGYDASGRQVVQSKTLADGSIVVTDAQGMQLARYSADEVDQVVSSR